MTSENATNPPRRNGGPNHNGGWNLADLTGKRYGDLIARKRSGTDAGTGCAMWMCECVRETVVDGRTSVCGTMKEVRGALLENRQVKSCGCRRRAKGAERTPRRSATEMLGMTYGKLVCEVLLPAEKASDGKRWICRCEGAGPGCIGTHTARAKDLRSGNTQSCGCLAGRGKGLRKGKVDPAG
jgi:hypothetical protein